MIHQIPTIRSRYSCSPAIVYLHCDASVANNELRAKPFNNLFNFCIPTDWFAWLRFILATCIFKWTAIQQQMKIETLHTHRKSCKPSAESKVNDLKVYWRWLFSVLCIVVCGSIVDFSAFLIVSVCVCLFFIPTDFDRMDFHLIIWF